MKILVVCDQGNNRSVTIAHQLKYWGHDVLTAGLATNGPGTVHMLRQWADRVIAVDQPTFRTLAGEFSEKVELWDVGPDVYPRPFNKQLLAKVRQLMQDHRVEYKS